VNVNRRIGLLTLVLLALVCAAGMALAGDATAPAAAPAVLSVEARYANVQRAMQENGIGFRAAVSIGDDGRLIVGVVPFDTLATK
jgi:hypothetical protein